MADFKLTDQWNNSIESWWKKHKSADTVDWRNERGVLPPVTHITRPICVSTAICEAVSSQYYIRIGEMHLLSRESIASGVFKERALKARMLRDVAERNSVLWRMGEMKPDCDISLEDGLRHAMKLGIPLEEDWPLDSSVWPVGDLKSFKISDYKEVDRKDTVTIKHMLRQFPLLCDVMVGRKFDKYSTGIYRKETRGLQRHAMILVGWELCEESEDEEDGGQEECWIVMNSWGETWGQKGFAYLGMNILSSVFYPVIIPPELC
ncbi:hypothetical protein ACFX13_005726 [Malus domestica]